MTPPEHPKTYSPFLIKAQRSLLAFSLVELLISVLLIAVTMLLIVGASGVIRQRGGIIRCVGNLKQLGGVVFVYAADNGGYFPRSTYGEDGQVVSWQSGLSGYLPAAQNGRTILHCPAESTYPITCFGMNQEFRIDAHGERSKIHLSQLVSPQHYVLIADTRGSSWITAGRKQKMVEVNGLTKRHGGIPNFLYGDGHVAPFHQELLGYSDSLEPFYQALWLARYQR